MRRILKGRWRGGCPFKRCWVVPASLPFSERPQFGEMSRRRAYLRSIWCESTRCDLDFPLPLINLAVLY